jgi:hypothetical protein
MITQGQLPFKLEITEEEITPRSGLVLYAEVLRALKVKEGVGEYFLKPGSNRGYEAWRFIEPILMMLYGGGRHIEDIREIRDDEALRGLIGMEKMPSLSTYGDWLVRMGKDEGLGATAQINKEVIGKVCMGDKEQDYTLDVDATVIEAEKKSARWTYKHVKGYQPILGFIAENSLVLAYEFREGSVPAHARAVEFLERCEAACPEGKRITSIRSDSAFYQAEVVNWCEKNGKKYTITADKDKGVKEAIETIADWERLLSPEGEDTGRDVGTAIHIMNKTESAFRLVVQRWKNEQMDLFSPEQWCYQVIATNLDELGAEEVVWWHNQRAQAENLIKELKIGFGMEQMTSGDFLANALYFSLGVLVYNTTQAQKLLFMENSWQKTTIATIRWKLVQIAGKVVRHGRQVILKLVAPIEKLEIFIQIRQRCLGFG